MLRSTQYSLKRGFSIASSKQEIFSYNYRQLLSNIPFIMGIGGGFDAVSILVKLTGMDAKNGIEMAFLNVSGTAQKVEKITFVTNTFLS